MLTITACEVSLLICRQGVGNHLACGWLDLSGVMCKLGISNWYNSHNSPPLHHLQSTPSPDPLGVETLPRIASGLDSMAIPPLQQVLEDMDVIRCRACFHWSHHGFHDSYLLSALVPWDCKTKYTSWRLHFSTKARKEIKTHSIILNHTQSIISSLQYSFYLRQCHLPTTEAVGKKVLFSPAKGTPKFQSIKAANQGEFIQFLWELAGSRGGVWRNRVV